MKNQSFEALKSFAITNPECKEENQQSNALNGLQIGVEMKKLELMEADHSKLKANFAPSCSSAKFRSHFVRLRNSPEYICCLNPNSLLVIHQLDDSLDVKQEYRGKQPVIYCFVIFLLRSRGTFSRRPTHVNNGCHVKLPCQDGDFQAINTPRATELEIILEVMENQPEDQHSQHGQGNDPNLYRSMRDRMHPPRMSAPSCIIPPTEQLIIRPHINFKLIFEEVFPTHRTNGLKRQISNFSRCENEKFYECWERYMEAINACPHHGFDTWLLVSYFYDGMSSSMKQILETMCGGDFMSKNPEEAMDFLSYVSEVSRGWDEPTNREMGKRPVQQMSRGGMYNLSEDMEMKAKVAAMARKIEEMELRKVHEVQAISEPQQQANPCSICQSFEHMVEECPTIPAAREMFGEQANLIGQWKPNSNAPYGNTYNSSWRNHPNFAWKPRPNPYQSPAQSSQQSQGQSSVEQALVSLSKVMGDFVSEQKSINSQLNQKIDNVESTLNKKIDGMHNELSQKIDNIQYSISRLTNLNTINEKGKFPSQPHQNPKGIHEVESKDEDSSKVRDVQAIITLRSGKEVHQPEHDQRKSIEKDDYIDEEPQKIVIKEEIMKKQMHPLFPQALYGKIIQSKSQVRDANFIWHPGKLKPDPIFLWT
ncbi:hypothetical protein AAG906_021804 [Vitis piasezkii]